MPARPAAPRTLAALIVTLAALAGCAAPAPVDPGAVAGRATPWPDPLADCASFASRPEYAPLRAHLALDNLAGQTAAMRADRAIPTRTERERIRRWADERHTCLSAAAYAQRPQSSLAMIAIDEEMLAATQALDRDLAAGKLGYGAYARRRQQIADAYNDDWQRAEREFVAELNAAAARRAQARAAFGYDDPFLDDRWGGPRPGISISVGRGL